MDIQRAHLFHRWFVKGSVRMCSRANLASDFVADHLRKELDFIQEAENAMTTAKFISEEPRLRDRVYIPKVYHQYTTKKVMTAEWIDGVRMTNIQGIKRLTGDLPPLPGGPAPLKGGTAAVLQTMVELFSAQIFQWGCVLPPGSILLLAR